MIRALWQDALGVDDIRDKDDFFDLGGNSLSLVQAAAQLRESFQVDVPLSELIENSSVAHWVALTRRALDADRESLHGPSRQET
jgi:acyl carrier protein